MRLRAVVALMHEDVDSCTDAMLAANPANGSGGQSDDRKRGGNHGSGSQGGGGGSSSSGGGSGGGGGDRQGRSSEPSSSAAWYKSVLLKRHKSLTRSFTVPAPPSARDKSPLTREVAVFVIWVSWRGGGCCWR
jgi:hypothetical protein